MLNKIEINKISQVAYVPAQITVSELDRLLSFEGFMSGYSPVLGLHVPLVDCVLQRIQNLYWLKYGGLEDLCVGGVFTTQKKRKIVLKHVPRAAVGADLKKVFVGSENHMGSFDEVILKIFSIPENELWGVVFLDSNSDCVDFVRYIYSQGIKPLFAKIAGGNDISGVCRSLNIVGQYTHAVVVKLTGLKGMVHAEKRVIQGYSKSVAVHWAEGSDEAEILDETIINAEALTDLFKKTDQLFIDQTNHYIQPEKKLIQYLERSPC